MRNMLTGAGREEISRGLAEGLEYKEIDRNPSVTFRDAARHDGRAQHRGRERDESAATDRQRPKAYAVDRFPRLRTVVEGVAEG